MISKVTQGNKELIKTRIAEINQALADKGESIRIDSFESYYANIVKISQLATNFHNAPYKFFLMPLDEPMFEINANQRTITVPNHFSKNGVGVYGDHMAEVLYFSVDRYFDYQDLYSVDEIVINWQFRANGTSRTQDVETKQSLALAPDDTFKPGKIVFGWVITNEMTPSRGTLTFSVSFVKHIGDQYEYVLNTRPSQVQIYDSLILEDPSVLDNMKRPVFSRLMNSRYTPDNVKPLEDPEFHSEPIKDSRGQIIGYKGLPEVINFDIDENGIESNRVVLQVLGRSVDDGNIVYDWSGRTSSGADDIAGNIDSQSFEYSRRDEGEDPQETDYIPVDTTIPEEHIVYFWKNSSNEFERLPLEDMTIEEAFSADNRSNVYVLGSSLVIETKLDDNNENYVGIGKAGLFGVSLQATKTVSQEGEEPLVIQNSGNSQPSMCRIPFAAVPKVELTAEGVNPTDIENVTLADEDIASQYIFIENSVPQLIANVSIDESKIDSTKGIVAESSLGAIGFKMASADDEIPSDFSDIAFEAPAQDSQYNILSGSATSEGEYRVYAVNRRNHTYSVSDPSNILKISKIAPKLEDINVEIRYKDEAVTVINHNEKVTPEVVISMMDTEDEDIYDYSFTVSVTHEDLPENVSCELSVIGLDRDGNDDTHYDLINTGEVTINNDAGSFIIRAITTYNGTQRMTETQPFKVLSDIG